MDAIDILVQVFTESDDDRCDWNSDQESYDAEEVFGDREDHEGDKYRKVNE